MDDERSMLPPPPAKRTRRVSRTYPPPGARYFPMVHQPFATSSSRSRNDAVECMMPPGARYVPMMHPPFATSSSRSRNDAVEYMMPPPLARSTLVSSSNKNAVRFAMPPPPPRSQPRQVLESMSNNNALKNPATSHGTEPVERPRDVARARVQVLGSLTAKSTRELKMEARSPEVLGLSAAKGSERLNEANGRPIARGNSAVSGVGNAVPPQLQNGSVNSEPHLAGGTETSVNTLVYLCIDRSGSMRTGDVRKADGTSTTRYRAVFDAARSFVLEQSSTDCCGSDDIKFSLILFNDEATMEFDRRSGADALDLLEVARTSRPPMKGTSFSAAFALICGSLSTQQVGPRCNVVVLFLSDGRPGDLPSHTIREIPKTYRSHRVTFPSIATHISSLRATLGDRLKLHFVGMYSEGFPWLRRLASSFAGEFYATSLELGSSSFNASEVSPSNPARNNPQEEDTEVSRQAERRSVEAGKGDAPMHPAESSPALKVAPDTNDGASQSAMVAAPRNAGSLSPEVEMVAVVSVDTRLRQQAKAARAKGNFITLSGHSTLHSSFNASEVSHSNPAPNKPQEEDTEVSRQAEMRSVEAEKGDAPMQPAESSPAPKVAPDTNDGASQSAMVAAPRNAGSLSPEVEMVAVVSVDTRLRQQAKAARAKGNFITLSRQSTLHSTFSTISTQVTMLRSSAVGRSQQRQERPVAIKSERDSDSSSDAILQQFTATRMLLRNDSFVFAPKERKSGNVVLLSMRPFARGGLRNVYRLQLVEASNPSVARSLTRGCKHLVAKESRYLVHYAERLAFHKETIMSQKRAAGIAMLFNSRIASSSSHRVEFLHCEVFRLDDSQAGSGKFRYLAVEPALDNGDSATSPHPYVKYNSNSGYVRKEETSNEVAGEATYTDVSQAFSHFSFVCTRGEEMVVDLQGCGLRLTDPQVHSRRQKYGRADRGEKGFEDFFASHVCGATCRAIGLDAKIKSESVNVPSQYGLAFV